MSMAQGHRKRRWAADLCCISYMLHIYLVPFQYEDVVLPTYILKQPWYWNTSQIFQHMKTILLLHILLHNVVSVINSPCISVQGSHPDDLSVSIMGLCSKHTTHLKSYHPVPAIPPRDAHSLLMQWCIAAGWLVWLECFPPEYHDGSW